MPRIQTFDFEAMSLTISDYGEQTRVLMLRRFGPDAWEAAEAGIGPWQPVTELKVNPEQLEKAYQLYLTHSGAGDPTAHR